MAADWAGVVDVGGPAAQRGAIRTRHVVRTLRRERASINTGERALVLARSGHVAESFAPWRDLAGHGAKLSVPSDSGF